MAALAAPILIRFGKPHNRSDEQLTHTVSRLRLERIRTYAPLEIVRKPRKLLTICRSLMNITRG